jgi:hypothetical protein
MTDAQRAGVLVVSLWVEGSGDTVRARVTETTDINAVGEMTSVVGSLDELLKAVETWARAFTCPEHTGPESAEEIGAVTTPSPPAGEDSAD